MFIRNDCKSDKVKTKDFCDFFIGEDVPQEIVDYFNKRFWNDVKEKLKAMSLWKKTWDKEDFQSQYELSCDIDNDDVKNLLNEYNESIERVLCKSSLELVNQIENDNEFQNKGLNIGCDREKENFALLYFRFLLYGLDTNNNETAAYAVWNLGRKCEGSDREKWYDALCHEIIYRNPDCQEIILMLHDKDIKPKTVFDVIKYREKNAMINACNGKIHNYTLSVSLFQHPKTPIGKLLKTSGLSSEETFRLVSELVKIPQLKKISGMISGYPFRKEDIIKEIEKFQEEETIRSIFLNDNVYGTMSKMQMNSIINTRISEIEKII